MKKCERSCFKRANVHYCWEAKLTKKEASGIKTIFWLNQFDEILTDLLEN